MAYLTHVLIAFGLDAILAIGLTLAFGVAGLVYLGYVAVVSVGAYAAAIFITTVGAPFPLAAAAGIALAAAVGWVVGLPTRDTRADAFALATFAVAWIIGVARLSWTALTGGALGIVGIPRPSFARENPEFLILVLGVLACAYAIASRCARSPFGRVLGAIRDDEIAARVLGKRTVAAKRACLAVASAIGGAAGVLAPSYYQFLHPSMFWLPDLFAVLTAAILGGLGSIPGAVVGAAVLTAIREGLRFTPLPAETLGAFRIIISGVILILVLRFRPKGLLGNVVFE